MDKRTDGEWNIAFFEKFAVYDCRFRTYTNFNDKNDKKSLALGCGEEELVMKLSAEKDGKRKIQIGMGKPHLYSQITTEYLPD